MTNFNVSFWFTYNFERIGKNWSKFYYGLFLEKNYMIWHNEVRVFLFTIFLPQKKTKLSEPKILLYILFYVLNTHKRLPPTHKNAL
jgi:hypothetical protein